MDTTRWLGGIFMSSGLYASPSSTQEHWTLMATDPPIDAPPSRAEWSTQTRLVTTHYLEVSRWLVGIHGAVLAALLAGAQFSGISDLQSGELRFWIGWGGLLAAFLSVWLSLFTSLRVGGGIIDLRNLSEDDLEEAHRQGLLIGFDESSKFFERREQLLLILQHLNDPTRPDIVVPRVYSGDIQQTLLREELQDMAWESHDLAALIENYHIRKRFGVARWCALIGVAITAIGILMAIWAMNPPVVDGQMSPLPVVAATPAV